jgi:protein O-mannosyl-transferase
MPNAPEKITVPLRVEDGEKWQAGCICVVLAALVWMVFGQTRGFEFVNYDDSENVYLNTQVANGLTLDGLIYAFTHSHVGHWNPLTTLSHMLVSQICGLSPGGHHLGNVLLHGTAAVLLFLVFWRMTGTLWRSAFIAAVFAIHPLRVESVAWVTERKDVLSGVFFMLTLAAYVRYVRQPQSTGRYVAVVVLFALGLMSKSMLVTLPFVLLLLDYWPLGRFAQDLPQQSFLAIFRTLIREKIPLLALSALCAVIQLFANQDGIISSEKMPLLTRVCNAVVSYVAYIGQMFYPVGLVVFYPHPENTLPAWTITLAIALLLAISVAVFTMRKGRPWLLVGWLWYLGIMVPVIGLVQSGELARADRYTYLPQIGLCLMLAWLAVDFCAGLRQHSLLLGSLMAGTITVLALTAYLQTSVWRNSEALWNHALACNPKNYLAHENLAGVSELKGRINDAIAHRHQALDINPDYEFSHNNIGLNLLESGRTDEAIPHFQRALEIKPRYPKALNNLGTALLQKGQTDVSIQHFSKALEIKPDYAVAEANLGNAFLRNGRVASAIFHYQKALEIAPDYAKARGNLGNALLQLGRVREAVSEFEKALAIQPDYQVVQNNLAWVLATQPDATLRDGPRAVALALQASTATGDKNCRILLTLAAAYAEAGRFPDAVRTAQRALQLPEAQADTALSAALRAQLEIYQSGSPFHERL